MMNKEWKINKEKQRRGRMGKRRRKKTEEKKYNEEWVGEWRRKNKRTKNV